MGRSTSGRDAWVDHAKAIGIALVVYGHVVRGLFSAGLAAETGLLRLADSVIYSFHMPLFFFLAGLYLVDSIQRRGHARFIAGKLDTILYPFVLWSIVQGSVEVLLASFTNGHATMRDVLCFFWAPRAQFWFLHMLFVLSMAFSFLYALFKGRAFALAICASTAVILLASVVPGHEGAARYAWFGFFLAVGIGFRLVADWYEASAGVLFLALLPVSCVAQAVFHFAVGPSYDSTGVYGLLLAVISVATVVAGSMYSARWSLPWLARLGAASLAIYVMHVLSGSGTRIVLSRTFAVTSVSTHIVAGTLLGVLVPYFVYLAAGRFGAGWLLSAPRWLSAERRVGGRGGRVAPSALAPPTAPQQQ